MVAGENYWGSVVGGLFDSLLACCLGCGTPTSRPACPHCGAPAQLAPAAPTGAVGRWVEARRGVALRRHQGLVLDVVGEELEILQPSGATDRVWRRRVRVLGEPAGIGRVRSGAGELLAAAQADTLPEALRQMLRSLALRQAATTLGGSRALAADAVALRDLAVLDQLPLTDTERGWWRALGLWAGGDAGGSVEAMLELPDGRYPQRLVLWWRAARIPGVVRGATRTRVEAAAQRLSRLSPVCAAAATLLHRSLAHDDGDGPSRQGAGRGGPGRRGRGGRPDRLARAPVPGVARGRAEAWSDARLVATTATAITAASDDSPWRMVVDRWVRGEAGDIVPARLLGGLNLGRERLGTDPAVLDAAPTELLDDLIDADAIPEPWLERAGELDCGEYLLARTRIDALDEATLIRLRLHDERARRRVLAGEDVPAEGVSATTRQRLERVAAARAGDDASLLELAAEAVTSRAPAASGGRRGGGRARELGGTATGSGGRRGRGRDLRAPAGASRTPRASTTSTAAAPGEAPAAAATGPGPEPGAEAEPTIVTRSAARPDVEPGPAGPGPAGPGPAGPADPSATVAGGNGADTPAGAGPGAGRVDVAELRRFLEAPETMPSSGLLADRSLLPVLERRSRLDPLDLTPDELDGRQRTFATQVLLRRAKSSLLTWEWESALGLARECLRFARHESHRSEALNLIAAAHWQLGNDDAAIRALASALDNQYTAALSANMAVVAAELEPLTAAAHLARLVVEAPNLNLRVRAARQAVLIWGHSDQPWTEGATLPSDLAVALRALVVEPLAEEDFREISRILAEHDSEWLARPGSLDRSPHRDSVAARLWTSRAKGLDAFVPELARALQEEEVKWAEPLRDQLVSAAVEALAVDEPSVGATSFGVLLLTEQMPMAADVRVVLQAFAARGAALGIDPDEAEPSPMFLDWLDEARAEMPHVPDDVRERVALAVELGYQALGTSYVVARWRQVEQAADLLDLVDQQVQRVPRSRRNRAAVRRMVQPGEDLCRQTVGLMARLRPHARTELRQSIDELVARCRELLTAFAGLYG